MNESEPEQPTTAADKAENPTNSAAEELELLRAELAEARDRVLRAQAELDNVRKRLRREMEEERRYAQVPLMADLLPVVDNLGRAIEAATKSGIDGQADVATLLDGVRMVAQQLGETLNRHGCQRIEALHQPFDPELHNAVMQQPSADHPPGTVIGVVQEGYQLHQRVVRPSQVIVSAAAD
jgi:molecular chaperone GrpE